MQNRHSSPSRPTLNPLQPAKPPPQQPPHQQQQHQLGEQLLAYFNSSTQLIFLLNALPLYRALCRPPRIGLTQDPDENALFTPHPTAEFDFGSPITHHPTTLCLTQDPAVGESYSLPQLLSPAFVNPAADSFAHLTTRLPWDLMQLLDRQDLSRWLDWLRESFKNIQSVPSSSFRTKIKLRPAPLDSLPSRKRSNLPSPLVHPTNPKNPDPSEIIMTAALIDLSAPPNRNPSASTPRNISNHHLIVFSAIVLSHPPQLDTIDPTATPKNPTFLTPYPPIPYHQYPRSPNHGRKHAPNSSSSNYHPPDGTNSSSSMSPPSSDFSRPKRMKTSDGDSFYKPFSSSCSSITNPNFVTMDTQSLSAPRKVSLTDGASRSRLVNKPNSKTNWLDEANAKRLLLKVTNKRSTRSTTGFGMSPNNNPTHLNPSCSPKACHFRRETIPSRSSLSAAAQELSNSHPPRKDHSNQTSLESMIIDDPWFRGLSAVHQPNPLTPVSQFQLPSPSEPTHNLPLQDSSSSPTKQSDPSRSSHSTHTITLKTCQQQQQQSEVLEPTTNSFKFKTPDRSRSTSFNSSNEPLKSSHQTQANRNDHAFDDSLFRKSLLASDVGKLIHDYDWENTPIGPIESWSPTLRSMISLILASPYRMSLLWGNECVMLYNDAYVKTCRRKHPNLLGQSGAHGWAEVWAELNDVADSVLQGEVYTVYDNLLFLDRDPDNPNGIRNEESYHSFSWIPIRGPNGDIEGILNPSFETTLRVIAERRLGSLRDLVQITLTSRTRVSYMERCLESFSKNPYDLPFVIMYSCEIRKRNCRRGPVLASTTVDETGSDTAGSSAKRHVQLKLVGTVGVPRGHPSAAEQIEFNIQIMGSNFQSSSGGSPLNLANNCTFDTTKSPSPSSAESQETVPVDSNPCGDDEIWPLKEACTFRKPIYICDLGDRAAGFEVRGWQDTARSAVVMPVSTSEDLPPLGVIIFGLSPRLYWNEPYALFLNLLTRQFSTGLSTVIGHEEEAQRMEELAALDRSKTKFFTNISHELRTPLTLIVGPISDILDSRYEISLAARDQLKVVERNTQRLIHLVNQLLDLSRFEAGKMVARFRSTDLSKLTTNLAALFRSAMVKEQLTFIVDCPDTHHRVWVDHDFYEKVIFNLLSNSLKFTPAGGQVLVKIRYDSTKCYLSCSDTGRGIKPEELPQIFDRFHRVEDSYTIEGTGIGLALVQDIVKLHAGLLDVTSEVDRGSTFTITFRLGVGHLPPDSLDFSVETELEKVNDRVMASNARRWILGDIESTRTSMLNASPCASEPASSRGSADTLLLSMNEGVLSTAGSTVLIADDNADMRGFLKSVLSRYFNVVEASDAQQAYQWAKLNKPDLLVSDVMMPGMDGFQLLKQLKADSDTATMSVILLSARAGSESRIEGLAEGADDYLVKPFEAKELIARVNTHLQIAKMRQRLEGAVATRTRLLRENEQKYRDLYHTFEVISMLSPVGIIQLNQQGQVTFVNNAFRSQSKLKEGEPLASWMNHIHESDQPEIEKTFELSIRTRQPIKGEFRWKDDTWCFYELRPYYKENHTSEGYLGSITDVTERKKSEREQLEAAEARARDAEESKRQQEAFIDMTSHEIRNPLHGIHQAAELLYSSLKFLHGIVESNERLSEENVARFQAELREDIDAIESIQLCASHQSRIADDIINVSKLSMGLLTTIKTDFDLVGRVREVLSMYFIEARQKSVDLKFQIGEGLETSHYISADPNRLAQVVINFLSNALRYTSSSEGPRSVTVRVDVLTKCPEPRPHVRRIGCLKPEIEAGGQEDLVYAKVSVQDTARGLSPDELSKLFSRFVQANPTQDQYGGSGLGLYVSHRLIENHGGFIEVMSTKGQGSVFSFVIPTKRSVKPTSSGTQKSHDHCFKRGFTRTLNEEEVVDMQPAFALLPVGTFTAGNSAMSRLSSPDLPHNRSTSSPRPGTSSDSHMLNPFKNVEPPPMPDHPSDLKRTHVLVVEDNMINVKVIKRQLAIKGYLVSVAMDGREALDKLYADASQTSGLPPINIVLMDIQMPIMDGLEAITQLRAAEKNGEIKKRYPVIAVTGNARKEQTEQCIASGFDSICVKPYKIDEVQSRMEALLANLKIDDP